MARINKVVFSWIEDTMSAAGRSRPPRRGVDSAGGVTPRRERGGAGAAGIKHVLGPRSGGWCPSTVPRSARMQAGTDRALGPGASTAVRACSALESSVHELSLIESKCGHWPLRRVPL